MPSLSTVAFALRHMDTGQFLCAQRDGEDYLICFSEHAEAEGFRDALGAREHCAITGQPIGNYPIGKLYLDLAFVDVDQDSGGVTDASADSDPASFILA